MVFYCRVHGHRRKGLTSLLLLTTWENWNERTVRAFRNKASMTTVILSSIKRDAVLWSVTGVKLFSNILPRESKLPHLLMCCNSKLFILINEIGKTLALLKKKTVSTNRIIQ